jgi:putative ABC transport system ATP-binding protein
MERGIFGFILRFSARDQLNLVLLSATALPFLYFSFELPKTIVNQAIGGEGGFPRTIFGQSFDQLPYLFLLCGLFLGLVLVNGAFKFFTSTYRYRVGDRLLRRLRYDLIERLLRFPVKEFQSTPSGQVVSMVTAETAPLGFFMAEAFAVPAVAAGTLGTIVLFMFMQDWLMGLAAIALYPLQIYLIPRIQRQVNNLQRQEVLAMRGVSDRIGELVASAQEIHGHDTAQYELASFTQRLGVIFNLRVGIGTKRYLVNILNQFFAQLTPFFFLSIGGYLVIIGDISLGALVAVLAAYKDMYSPWKDLIDYYQKAEDARVKYDQLREYFAPPGLMDLATISADPDEASPALRQLIATSVVVEAEEGIKAVDGATLTLQLPVHAAIVGGTGSGREEFARLLARQVAPQSGRLSWGEHDMTTLPDSVTGRRIGYVGPEAYLGSGTIRDVLVYPLLRRPVSANQNERGEPARKRREIELREATQTGNSCYDYTADWIDYAAAGCTDRESLRGRVFDLLQAVEIEREIYDFGMRRAVDPAANPRLAGALVAARKLLHQRLQARKLTSAVETFDRSSYIINASVAENILFGTPVGPTFALDRLGENDYLLKVIESVGLKREFLEKGRKLAAIMADIFRDLAPGHDFFERFSFIRAEDLAEFDAILRRAESTDLEDLAPEDRARLMALPFKLIAAQHHVGLIDAEFQSHILAAREAFARDLPAGLKSAVQFFDIDSFNAASSITDNVLFGKLSAAKARGAAQVNALVGEVFAELGLDVHIIDLGLDFDIGIGAAKLSTAQRQKIAIARSLIKRPDLLILNDAFSALEHEAQDRVFANIRTEMHGRSLVLLEPSEVRADKLDVKMRMANGKIVEQAKNSNTRTQVPEPDDQVIPGNSVGLYELTAILLKIPLFADIDRSKLKLLAFTSERLNYEAGQNVFRQGENGDKAYVVLDGIADVVLESSAGENVVAQLGRYQVFGEMALLSSMPRATTIRAHTTLSLLALSHDVFLRLVEENADIAVGMTRILAERLASTLRDYGRVSAQVSAQTSPHAMASQRPAE